MEDEVGTDFAVQHASTEVMAFPFSSVWKRIGEETGFIHGVFSGQNQSKAGK